MDSLNYFIATSLFRIKLPFILIVTMLMAITNIILMKDDGILYAIQTFIYCISFQ